MGRRRGTRKDRLYLSSLRDVRCHGTTRAGGIRQGRVEVPAAKRAARPTQSVAPADPACRGPRQRRGGPPQRRAAAAAGHSLRGNVFIVVSCVVVSRRRSRGRSGVGVAIVTGAQRERTQSPIAARVGSAPQNSDRSPALPAVRGSHRAASLRPRLPGKAHAPRARLENAADPSVTAAAIGGFGARDGAANVSMRQTQKGAGRRYRQRAAARPAGGHIARPPPCSARGGARSHACSGARAAPPRAHASLPLQACDRVAVRSSSTFQTGSRLLLPSVVRSGRSVGDGG
jgi:hypothetical protein